jgi:hypothetical protein
MVVVQSGRDVCVCLCVSQSVSFHSKVPAELARKIGLQSYPALD